ncbi:response regulator transcription factor [Celeribacter indicus]|uniref:LuxR family transcriptional regulator n=1 Tax=Celeribacter indicus TaxID=1208324 RepID=A0A0B5DPF6_9RHOB|nr:helix-turn-helix domain-containing protein [Celeribacter indicus]AJE45473.1 LuxR family transcriptional regulator [Celeribacter indicus]SDX02857.1 two-component system, NarL family, nitrate/nitrite response regulator NarL [Celeribacter indicus]
MKSFDDTLNPLSPRQAQILCLMAQGYRLSEIADRLGISGSAVNLYLSNTRQKLGLKTKEHCLALAIEKGWLATSCAEARKTGSR